MHFCRCLMVFLVRDKSLSPRGEVNPKEHKLTVSLENNCVSNKRKKYFFHIKLKIVTSKNAGKGSWCLTPTPCKVVSKKQDWCNMH